VTTYTFSFLTDVQAQGYLQANDRILFATGTASQATVVFNPFTATSPVSITVSVAGHSVTFADSASVIRGQVNNTFIADDSMLFIGTTGNDNQTGTAGADGMFGGAGDDSLSGGAGGDLLQGAGTVEKV